MPTPTDQSPRLQFLSHKGVQIVLLDFSHATYDEVAQLMHDFNEWITPQKPNSLAVLFDVLKSHYSPSLVNLWKKNIGRYDPYIRKSAFINPNAFFKLLVPSIRAFVTLVGIPMKADRGRLFDSKEAALDWLAQ